MKSLDHYKSLHYKVVIDYDAEDSVFVVRFPELPGCVADGETEAEALSLALKMKDSWLETAYNTGWDMPEPRKPVEANGRVTVRMPKSLHRDVLEMAEADGISLNQLLVTFISREVGRKEAVRTSTQGQPLTFDNCR